MATVVEMALVTVLVVTYMLQVGLSTRSGAFRKVPPAAIVRGLVVMLVLGPLLAAFIARIMAPPRPVVGALILLSTVGILPLASRRTAGLEGHRETGLVLTLVLSIVAIFTAIPTAKHLLAYTAGIELRPGSLILKILLLQGLPLAIGVMIGRRTGGSPSLVRLLGRINSLALIGVVALLLVPRLGTVLVVGWRGAVATIIFALLLEGLAFWLGGPAPADKRATAAISNMPNVGLALTIANAAQVPRAGVAALLGVFIVRTLTGGLLQQVGARRLLRPSVAR